MSRISPIMSNCFRCYDGCCVRALMVNSDFVALLCETEFTNIFFFIRSDMNHFMDGII